MKAVTLNRTSVVGGSSSVVTATIKIEAATTVPLTITLSSNAPLAAIPDVPSVVIPAGSTQAVVGVTHFPVTVKSVAKIKGTVNGTSKTASLTVKKPA
jgi:hypothetical protein